MNKRFTVISGLCVLLAGMLISDVRAAEPAEAPASQPVLTEAKNLRIGGRGKKQDVQPVKADGGNTAKITWQTGGKRLVEAYINDKPILMAFSKGVDLTIPVNTDTYPDLKNVGVRLIDGNGEIFQFGGLKLPDGAGWKDWVVKLAPGGTKECWGGDKNKRMDLPVRLLSLLFMAPENKIKEERSFMIGSIRRSPFSKADVSAESLLVPVKVNLATPTKVKVVPVGKESECYFAIDNPEGNAEISVDFVAELTAFDGTKAKVEKAGLVVAPGATGKVPFPSSLPRTGWWKAESALLIPAKNVRIGKRSVELAYMKPAGPRPLPPEDGFWFGIDARIRDNKDGEWRAETCAMIGMDFVRGGPNWPAIEKQPGKFDWEKHRETLEIANKYGVRTMHSITFTPEHAVRPEYIEKLKQEKQLGKTYTTPPQTDALKRFAAAVTQVNTELKVPFIDLWNEPDLYGFWRGTTDEYLDFMKTAYESVKSVNPDMPVLSGGIALVSGHGGHSKNPDLIRRMLVDGQDYYDAMSLHMHGPFRVFQPQIDGKIAKYQGELKQPKPIVFTETGVPLGRGWSPKQQAGELVKKISFGRARGAIGFTWFILLNSGGDTSGYAILGDSYQPKAMLPAYNELVKLMRGTRFKQEVDVGDGNWLFHYQGAGRALLVGWDERSASEGQAVLVKIPAGGKAELIDVMGNASTAEDFEGVVTWPLMKAVKYLQVTGGEPLVKGSLVAFPEEPYGQPGKIVTVRARMTNPLDRPVPFNLTWTQLDGSTKAETVTVQPGNATATLPVTMPAMKAGDETPSISLAYVLDGTPWKGELKLPLNVARQIPAAPMAERPADFVMEDKEKSIFNAHENDPNSVKWTWQGPQDVSGKVWLGLEGDTLVVKVDATDDVHSQPFDAGNSWKADGIQMGLLVPGRDGVWKIGFARSDKGELMTHCWESIVGESTTYADKIQLTVTPREGGMVYLAKLPLEGLGLTPQILKEKAIGFNLILNDQDSGKREGFAFAAPGMGTGMDTKLWPMVTFE